MGKVILAIIILVVGGAFYQKTRPRAVAEDRDKKMQAIVAEMRAKLPLENGPLKVDRVEYADNTLAFSGFLKINGALDPAAKTLIGKELTRHYCAHPVMAKNGIGVKYEIRSVQMQSLGDKLSTEIWSTSIAPDGCGPK